VGEVKKILFVSAVAFVAMVFLCFPQKGLADLVTVRFVGEVSDIAKVPISSQSSWETDGYFKVGDRFDGSYRYQSDLPPFGQGNPAVSGSYSKYEIEAIKFFVGSVSGAATRGNLLVSDGYSNSHMDQYGFYAEQRNIELTGSDYPYTLLSFSLMLSDKTASVFDTSALPLTVPTLNKFTSTLLTLTFGQDLSAGQYAATLVVSGNVTVLEQIAPIATPVPASLLLLGSGLIGLVGSGLRRMNK